MKLLLLALFLLPVASTTEAATYWVSKSSDGNQHCFNSATQPGSLATQSSFTIEQGINCMSSGDTLYVMSGTYFEAIGATRNSSPSSCSGTFCIPNGTQGSPTRVTAAPGHERLAQIFGVSGNRPVTFQGFVSHIEISGFVIDANGAGYVIQLNCPGSSCVTSPVENLNFPHFMTFDNNEIRNASAFDCVLGGEYNIWRRNNIHSCNTHALYVGGKNLIESNWIHNTGLSGASGVGYCVQLNSSYPLDHSVVRNNLFTQCKAGAVVITGDVSTDDNMVYNNVSYDNGAGYSVFGGQRNQIINNTSYAERTGENGKVSVFLLTSNNIVRNNLMVDTDGIVDFAGGNTVSNNTSLSNGNSVFVNVASFNFTLQAGAGAINVGATISSPSMPALAPSVDYSHDANGVFRAQGAAWDTGACEYFNGAASCPSFPAAQPPPPQPTAVNTPTTGPSGITITTGTLQIGGSQFGEYFKGLIDEVRIYNRALSDTEIQAIYQQDSGAASRQ